MKTALSGILTISAILLTGCSAESDYVPETTDDHFLSFTLDASSLSRSLVYDGVKTAFSEGSEIGCVIATRSNGTDSYEYTANSCWIYKQGRLKLSKLYGTDNNLLANTGNGIIQHYDNTNNPIISEYSLELLKKDSEYSFYFYYPYVDGTTDPVNATGYTYKYPNGDTESSETIIPIVAKEDQTSATSDGKQYFSWLNYPIISHTDFAGTDNSRLEANEFMYAAVTTANGNPIIGNSKNGKIPVVFKKMMATVDVVFNTTDVISDVQLRLNNNDNDLPRIYYFNMQSGAQTNIGTTPSSLQSFANYPKDADGNIILSPKNINPDKENTFRLILPPSSDEVGLSLSFSVKSDEAKDATPITKVVSEKIQFQAGHRYLIKIDKLNWHVDMIEDWKDGGSQDLSPNK